ncbi:MAG TPA: hypothetical protein VLA56_12180 [Pseudomonadales bacterium]|nr:hypothetical protein [Pseudomonadales bacterium]
MNPILRMHRLHQPRSNRTTNLLLAATITVFTLIADTALDQQRSGAVAQRQSIPDHGVETVLADPVRAIGFGALLPRLLF